jgi:hypothetical protein
LAARPIDDRGRPVPFTAVVDQAGHPDFTAVDVSRALQCARERRCGVCGQRLGYWIAFLGGPKAAEARTYLDAPMCGGPGECAEMSLELCPHISREATRRARRAGAGVVEPEVLDMDKPAVWVLYLTRDFTWQMHEDRTNVGAYPVFHPAAAKSRRAFRYIEGRLSEVVSGPNDAVGSPSTRLGAGGR